MNANYSEALEQQVSLARLMSRVDLEKNAANYLAKERQQMEAAGHPVSDADLQWARASIRNTLDALTRAQTFYWSSPMCQLLRASARTMPLNWELAADSWPAPAGFCWFTDPIPDELVADDLPLDVIALSWSTGAQRDSWVTLWSQVEGVRFPTFQEYWPVGESVRSMASRQHGRTAWLRIIAAALALLEQRILVTRHQAVERHARKRLEREGWQHESLIRVVELRRKERVGDKQPVQPVEREWSCQWMVRGHWRQQFYPSKHTNQLLWITPYVKGPDDKPLKPPRATVFAVVR